MRVGTRILCRGSAYTICEIVRDGKWMIEDFSRELSRDQQAGIIALIRRIAEEGPPSNPSRFKHEEDQIYAIKDGQVRIYCFFDKGALILLTNGAIKKSQKAAPVDLAAAKQLRAAYLESQQ